MTVFQPFRINIAESPILTTISGSVSTAKTGYIKIFFQNLAGTNLGSVSSQFNITASQGLRVTIPQNMVKTGELPERYIIGYSTTGNDNTFIQIASIKALDSTGELLALPSSVDITTEDGFNSNLSASSFNTLPSNVQSGKLAVVLDTGAYYQYLNNVWISFWKGNTQLIEPVNVDSTGGYLQDSISLNTFTENIFYAANGNFSRSFYIGYLNDGASPIPSSTLVGLVVLINGVPNSSLAERLEIRLRGYVSLSTGELDTSSAVGYPTLIWNGSRDSGFIIPTDLPSQSVALFSVRFKYNASELSTVQPNSSIALDLFLYTQGSTQADYGAFTGNFIADIGEYLAVTPSTGLALNIASGQALVGKRQSTIKQPQVISQLLNNTINQKLIIDSEINARIEQSAYVLRSNEAVLAVVDTIPANIISTAKSISVPASGGIQISLINYITSNKIRSDYPDEYIAGKAGTFNVDNINVYLYNGTTYYKYTLLAANIANQIITITDLPNTTPSLPVSSANEYGLYKPDSYTLSSLSGNLPVGTYQVYIEYQWLNTSVTRIQAKSSTFTIKKLGTFVNTLSATPKYDAIVLSELGYDPTTQSNEIVLFNKNNELAYRTEDNGLVKLLSNLGANLIFANGIPSDTLGTNNDVYFNIALGTVYKKAAGSWGSIQLDLVITSELVSILTSYVTQSALNTTLNNYTTATQLNNAIANFINQSQGDARYLQLSNANETIDDRAAALLTTGAHTGITFAYDDDGNKLNATVTATSSGGDMTKAVYDTNNNNAADRADSLTGIGAAANNTYYGKNSAGTEGFFAPPAGAGTGDMLKSTYDTNNSGAVDAAESVSGIEAAASNTYYGKNGAGTPGFFALPAGGSSSAITTSVVALTSPQSIPRVVDTPISFPTPGSDPLGVYSSSTPSTLTVPAAGTYLIGYRLLLDTNAAGGPAISDFAITLKIGDSEEVMSFRGNIPANSSQPGTSLSGVFVLSANTQIRLFVYQNSGGALSTYNNFGSAPRISITKLS